MGHNNRTYERTHPWIKFQVDLTRVPYEFWTMLGECLSKCDHLAGIPLQPEHQQEFYRVYLAKGVQGTTAIEGNTLSEDQVRDHIEGRLQLPPSQKYLEKEIDNIINACNWIGREVRHHQMLKISVEAIKEFNRRVLEGLQLEEDVVPGEVSRHVVGVGTYRGCPREDCEYLLSRLAGWLNGDDFAPKEDCLGRVGRALIKAILSHMYLAWIHPFGDGNGRTARLMEFQVLLASGVPGPAAHLLSNFYNQTRVEYFRQLDYASKSGGDVTKFLVYAVQGFRDGLREQIDKIRLQQWEVTWINYVHKQLGKKDSGSNHRRRKLVLELSKQAKAVSVSEIRQLSADLALAYANKTEKTTVRDLNALIKMELVLKDGRGYKAHRDRILAWLPMRVGFGMEGKVGSNKTE